MLLNNTPSRRRFRKPKAQQNVPHSLPAQSGFWSWRSSTPSANSSAGAEDVSSRGPSTAHSHVPDVNISIRRPEYQVSIVGVIKHSRLNALSKSHTNRYRGPLWRSLTRDASLDLRLRTVGTLRLGSRAPAARTAAANSLPLRRALQTARRPISSVPCCAALPRRPHFLLLPLHLHHPRSSRSNASRPRDPVECVVLAPLDVTCVSGQRRPSHRDAHRVGPPSTTQRPRSRVVGVSLNAPAPTH